MASGVTGPGAARPASLGIPPWSLAAPRVARLARRLTVVGAALLLLAVAALLLLRAAHPDQIYPGVYAADISLGGLTREEGRAALQQRVEPIEAAGIRFTAGSQVWTPSLPELGLRFDLDAALERSYQVGRERHAWDRLRSSGALARRDERIPLGVTLDRAALDRWFDSVDRDFPPTRDAALAVDGTDVSIVPEIVGTVVDRPRATARMLEAVSHLQPIAEPLPARTNPPTVIAADLTTHRDNLVAALSRPVAITFGSAAWTLEPAELGQFVVQRVDPSRRGPAAVTLDLDQRTIAAWLTERYGPEIEREPRNAVVGWNDRPVVVEESIGGVTLKSAAFASAVAASLFGQHTPVVVPVERIEPAVRGDQVGQLGITTRLARGDSYYGTAGSERDTNVEIGASLLNGTLVPPGGEFSFNAAIGEITSGRGYLESEVVEAERAGRDIGGGICQVSTTVFRAALLAGLPITEWWPHTYRLRNYEIDGWGPGYDASILQVGEDPAAWGDFRFANPTDSWLLVEAWTADGYVIVNIYGPDLGYDTRFSETTVSDPITTDQDIEVVNPELEPGSIIQTEYPINGFEVAFTRDVVNRDGDLVESHQFYTRFRERANVYQVSPEMQGTSLSGPD
jgi:vancomycin resistance protein YoaR